MNIKAIAEKISLEWEEALEYYGGDISLLKDKLASFKTDTDFDSLKNAVEKEDDEAVKKGAHKIRKASEKVGLVTLAKLAGELENTKGLRSTAIFLDLENEYKKTVKALEEN